MWEYVNIVNAAQALSNLIDLVPLSIRHVVQQGGIDILISAIQNIQYAELSENSIKVLDILANEHGGKILEKNGLPILLDIIDFFEIKN
jgi:hypothetical protein